MTGRGKLQPLIAIFVLVVLALLVGGYILSQERLVLPSWVPVFGRSFYVIKGEFQTAQAVTPGQGQAVTVAGVKVGDITAVDLENGRAVVTMEIQHRYAPVYRNATMLLRPKTELKDMTVELNKGTTAAGALSSGATLPIAQTAPDVNFDEILSSLDSDSQAYLQSLIGNAGLALRGNGATLGDALVRFDPTTRDLEQISRLLAQRHVALARVIGNFSLLATALGAKDRDLATLVNSSNAVLATFAGEDASVRRALALLPGALQSTRSGLGRLSTTAALLGPTLARLHPFATQLAPGLEASRPLFANTTPVIANQLRPFARASLPVVRQLAPAAASVAAATPSLTSSFNVLNQLFNELAYNPGPGQQGFLYSLAWANHNVNSLLSAQDGIGPVRHGLLLFDCNSLSVLEQIKSANPTVSLLLDLLNPPNTCPKPVSAAAPAATAPATATAPASASALAAAGGTH